MNTTTVTVESVTYAQKIKRLLEKRSIRSKLIKNSGDKSGNGCAFGIRIDSRYLYDVVSILKENGINYTVITDTPKK